MLNIWNKKAWIFIPMLIIIAIVPLIVCLKMVNLSGIAYDAWPARNVNLDFFSYYKANWIVIFSTIGWFIFLFKVKKFEESKNENYYIPLFIMVILVVISTMLSPFREIALKGVADRYESAWVLVSYFLITIILMNTIEKVDEVKLFIKAFFLSCIIIGIIGILQYFGADIFKSDFGSSLIVPDAIEKTVGKLSFRFGAYTIYSTLYNTNYVGSYMVMAFMVIIPLYLTAKNILWRIGSSLILFLVFSNWIGCRSRAGIIGGIFAFIIMGIIMRKTIVKEWKKLIVAIIVSAFIFLGMDYASGWRLSGKYSTLKNEAGGVSTEKGLKDITVEGNKIIIEKYNFKPFVISLNYDKQELILSGINGEKVPYKLEQNKILIEEKGYEKYSVTLVDQSRLELRTNRGKIELQVNKDEIFYLNNKGEKEEFKSISKIDRIKALDGKEQKGSGRIYIWSRTIPVLKNYLLFGSGPDTFSLRFPQYDRVGKLVTWGDPDIIVDKPHNMYLQMAVNTGILFLVTFLVLIGWYFIESFKIYFNSDFSKFEHIVGAGLFFAVIGYCGAGFFNDSLVSVAPVFWSLLGIGIAVNKINKIKRI